MVLQKVVEEHHVEVTDRLMDDSNAIIKVGVPPESACTSPLGVTSHTHTLECAGSPPQGCEVRWQEETQVRLQEPLSLPVVAEPLGMAGSALPVKTQKGDWEMPPFSTTGSIHWDPAQGRLTRPDLSGHLKASWGLLAPPGRDLHSAYLP